MLRLIYIVVRFEDFMGAFFVGLLRLFDDCANGLLYFDTKTTRTISMIVLLKFPVSELSLSVDTRMKILNFLVKLFHLLFYLTNIFNFLFW